MSLHAKPSRLLDRMSRCCYYVFSEDSLRILVYCYTMAIVIRNGNGGTWRLAAADPQRRADVVNPLCLHLASPCCELHKTRNRKPRSPERHKPRVVQTPNPMHPISAKARFLRETL